MYRAECNERRDLESLIAAEEYLVLHRAEDDACVYETRMNPRFGFGAFGFKFVFSECRYIFAEPPSARDEAPFAAGDTSQMFCVRRPSTLFFLMAANAWTKPNTVVAVRPAVAENVLNPCVCTRRTSGQTASDSAKGKALGVRSDEYNLLFSGTPPGKKRHAPRTCKRREGIGLRGP
eukprot:3452502-Prymnesium_polylepis.1